MQKIQKITTLLEAVLNDDVKAVKLLLKAGADPNIPDERGNTPVRLLLESGVQNERGNIDLMIRKEMILNLLIKAGADVNIQNYYGWTVLMFAPDIFLPLLLNAGADINMQDENGYTALMHRISDDTYIQSLIKAGADIHIKDKKGNTALMHAAMYNLDKAVQTLIEAGADINTTNDRIETPLILTVLNDEYDEYNPDDRNTTTKLLLKYEADMNIKTKDGKTALMYAILKDHICIDRVAGLLLEAGADVTIQDNNGKTAFEHAQTIEFGDDRDPIVYLLQEAGADIGEYEFGL